MFDRTLPPILAELNALPYDYNGGDGVDFEPYDAFQDAEENRRWITAWTGNKTLDGGEYRVFGQDGTGGYAAIWLARPGAPLEDQPIVFFGSEGELGVVASSLADYAWLLASGIGPCEALAYPTIDRAENEAFAAVASRHGSPRRSRAEVLAAAATAFPNFVTDVRALCG